MKSTADALAAYYAFRTRWAPPAGEDASRFTADLAQLLRLARQGVREEHAADADAARAQRLRADPQSE